MPKNYRRVPATDRVCRNPACRKAFQARGRHIQVYCKVACRMAHEMSTRSADIRNLAATRQDQEKTTIPPLAVDLTRPCRLAVYAALAAHRLPLFSPLTEELLMLVLRLKESKHHDAEEVVLTLPDGREVVVCVTDVEGRTVRLGFQAPADMNIQRRRINPDVEDKEAS